MERRVSGGRCSDRGRRMPHHTASVPSPPSWARKDHAMTDGLRLGLRPPLVALLTSVLLASAWPSRTDAADWQYLSNVPKEAWFVDTASVTTSSEGYVQVWTKEVYNDEAKRRFVAFWQGKLGGTASQLSEVTEEHTLVEIDCRSTRFRPVEFIWYGKEGGTVIHALHPGLSEEPKWYFVVPNKPGVLLYNTLCK